MIQRKRESYLDALRILAIFCVVYLHTGKYGVLVYAYTDSPVEKTLGYLFAIVTSELPVPLFFMISGALLLGKKESLRDLFKKRILRIVFILFVASFFMYLYKCYTGVYHFDLSEFFYILCTKQVVPAYWYLYAYIAYLLCLPFLRILASHMEKSHYTFLFVLNLLLGSLPNILQLFHNDWGLNSFLSIPFTEIILFYPLMGYGISKFLKSDCRTAKPVLWLWLFGLLSLASTYFFTRIYNLQAKDFTSFDKGIFQSSLICFFVFSVFITTKYAFEKKAPSIERAFHLSKLSSLVFGIYLIETPIREGLKPLAIWLHPYMGVIPSTLIWSAMVVFIGGMIIFICKKYYPKSNDRSDI